MLVGFADGTTVAKLAQSDRPPTGALASAESNHKPLSEKFKNSRSVQTAIMPGLLPGSLLREGDKKDLSSLGEI